MDGTLPQRDWALKGREKASQRLETQRDCNTKTASEQAQTQQDLEAVQFRRQAIALRVTDYEQLYSDLNTITSRYPRIFESSFNNEPPRAGEYFHVKDSFSRLMTDIQVSRRQALDKEANELEQWQASLAQRVEELSQLVETGNEKLKMLEREFYYFDEQWKNMS